MSIAIILRPRDPDHWPQWQKALAGPLHKALGAKAHAYYRSDAGKPPALAKMYADLAGRKHKALVHVVAGETLSVVAGRGRQAPELAALIAGALGAEVVKGSYEDFKSARGPEVLVTLPSTENAAAGIVAGIEGWLS